MANDDDLVRLRQGVGLWNAWREHWVLEPYSYNTEEHLVADLGERVIGPAEAKVRELRG
jgi:hypothetical protein